MSEFEQEWVNQLKSLETPHDIVEAIAGLSRQEEGRVMVKMENKEGDLFWFGPKAMQEDLDTRGSTANVHVKFSLDVQYRGFRISEVTPLEVDDRIPNSYVAALDRFGLEHNCHRDASLGYSGKLLPNESAKTTIKSWVCRLTV